jgi:DNA-binding response OmpR family regulator
MRLHLRHKSAREFGDNGCVTVGVKSRVLTVGPLEVYVDDEFARVEGQAVTVGGHAFGLLVALARQPGAVVGRDVLYREVWGRELRRRDRSVDVCIFKLRNVLEQASSRCGYRLAPQRRPYQRSTPR